MSAERLVKRLRAAARRPADRRRARCRAFACPSRRARVRRRCVLDRLGAGREVSGAPHRGGGDLAGFEIALAPGAITYWRDPGDAGLPPTLDFSASDNVASVEPEFPAPKRIKEADGGEAFGYDGGVVFPLRSSLATPRSPRRSSSTPTSPCARKCACRRRRISSSRFRPLRLSLRGRDRRRSRGRAARRSRRRISARSRRSTRIAGASARPMKTAPARPVRRGAGGLVAEDRARARRRRPGLLHADHRRQTERRRPSGCAQAHAHRRRGGGGDDDRGQAENARRPLLRIAPGDSARFTGQAPVV